MPQTPAWRAPENIFSSSNTLVSPPQPQTMAPARAVAVSICITIGACCLLAPQPKSLLTYIMAHGPWIYLHFWPQAFSFPILNGKIWVFLVLAAWLWACPTSLAFHSLLSASLFNKKSQKTAQYEDETSGSHICSHQCQCQSCWP